MTQALATLFLIFLLGSLASGQELPATPGKRQEVPIPATVVVDEATQEPTATDPSGG